MKMRNKASAGDIVKGILVLALLAFVFFFINRCMQPGALTRDVNGLRLGGIKKTFDPMLAQYAAAGQGVQFNLGVNNGPQAVPASETLAPITGIKGMKAIVIGCSDNGKLPDGSKYSISAGVEPPPSLYKLDQLYFSLPAALAAAKPEEVNTVVKLVWHDVKSASYTDGASYYTRCVYIIVVDLATGSVVGEKDIRATGHAPSTKHDSSSIYSGYPSEEAVAYIKSLALQ
jgi:hypothetical protein